jgi:hypothetical protein
MAAATLGLLAQAAPAAADPVIPQLTRPWAASMATAHAKGTYTVTQPGLARTYTITGVLANDWGGQCYVLKVSGGFPSSQQSEPSCDPSSPVRINFKVTTAPTSTPPVVQVCRGATVIVGCGQAVPLR